jgi:uncharacterized protein
MTQSPQTTSHPTAEAIVRAHLALVTHDHPRWLSLFADDAVVEFPYAASLGRSTRLEGKAAIDAYFSGAAASFRDLAFRDVRIHVSTEPGVVVAEAHGSAQITTTGKTYEQDYVMIVETSEGKIRRYREYWNVLPGIEAFGGMDALTRLGLSS